jgi:hypothetical protein
MKNSQRKKKGKEEAMYIADTCKNVGYRREIEMLKVVLYLVCRNNRRSKAS